MRTHIPGWVQVADIVGVWEIAEDLKVSRTTVARWVERRDSSGFPEPLAKLHGLHVYNRAEVRDWFEAWSMTRRGYYGCGEVCL
jgi:transposase